MSKKMFKRSLALGALMAFVITGSAMAADVEFNKGLYLHNDYLSKCNFFEFEDLIKVDNVENITINSDSNGIVAHYLAGGRVEGKPDITYVNIIKPNSDLTINAESGGISFIAKSEIKVKDLYINSKGNALAADGSAAAVITANKIELNVDEGRGILVMRSNEGMPSLTLNVEESLIVNSNDHGLRVGDGQITINAPKADVQITSVSGSAVKVGVGAVSVDTDSLSATGDIIADGTGRIDLTASSDMSIKGIISTAEGGTTKLTSNSLNWTVTGASNVSEIAGNDAKLTVEDAEAAAGWVKVDKVTAKELTVATETDDSKTQETLDALAKVAVYSDDADKSAATQVQLKNAIYDNVVADVTADGVKITDSEVASANVSVNDMVAIGMMSWRAEMNDMNKRMGELRNANGEHGVWVRMVRGESEFNSVKNQYNQYQLGYDEKLSVDKRWTVGAAISYTDAENNFAEGTGESTNKAFSVYGSKLNDDGTFVDLIAKYARLDNDFKTYSGMGDAEYDTNAYSFSAEVGKRIQQGKGLWIEPQVELTYGKVSAVDYVTKNNVSVAQDGMESLVGRIGFSLGKDIEKGNLYARASYLYDFDGETKAVLDGDAVLTNDLGGGWWEVGVGANINLSKATYIYADVEKTFGGEVDTNWQWNLGVRYSF